jgi:HEAT repeat protein
VRGFGLSVATTSDLSEDLSSADEKVRLDAISRAARRAGHILSEEELAALIRCLGSSRKTIQRRAADALAGAATRNPRAIDAIREALHSEESSLRWGAAYSLGLIPGALDLRACDAVIEALANSDGDVRWAAAEMVVRLASDQSAAVLAALMSLAAGSNPNARKMALYCLRDLNAGGNEILAVLKSSSSNEDSHVRLAALSLLGSLADGNSESAEIALACLQNDQDHGVRRAAAVALGRLGHSSVEVHRALSEAAEHESDTSLRKAARQALEKLARN